MFGPLKWLLLLIVTIRAQDPRKKNLLVCHGQDIDQMKLQKFGCNEGNGKCISKRYAPEETEGPFWANRGKKDPIYIREPLYAEEPYWLILRDTDLHNPFFLSRGKKETGSFFNNQFRDTRELVEENDTPFFASRGKRFKSKN